MNVQAAKNISTMDADWTESWSVMTVKASGPAGERLARAVYCSVGDLVEVTVTDTPHGFNVEIIGPDDEWKDLYAYQVTDVLGMPWQFFGYDHRAEILMKIVELTAGLFTWSYDEVEDLTYPLIQAIVDDMPYDEEDEEDA